MKVMSHPTNASPAVSARISSSRFLAKSLKGLCLGAFACAGLAVQAQSLLVNGSFETRNFSGWTVSGNPTGINVLVDNHSFGTNGACSVVFNAGDTAPTAGISQTFATTPGVEYTLSFDYATGYGSWGVPAQSLTVGVSNSNLGSQRATSLTHTFVPTFQPFKRFTYTFVATSASSTLSLNDESTNFTWSADGVLDNISVIANTPADTTAPVISLPANIVAEATSASGATVTFVVSATDDIDGSVPVTLSAASGSVFPLGTTTVLASATDAAGHLATGSFNVTVLDRTAPAISSVTPSVASLWPANHKMVTVKVAAVATDALAVTSLRIVSVVSSELDNGLGDGDTANDVQITGPLTINLRAERSGSGVGRTYTITVEARDAAANASIRTTTVSVPLNLGGK